MKNKNYNKNKRRRSNFNGLKEELIIAFPKTSAQDVRSFLTRGLFEPRSIRFDQIK